ncbi:methyl-coenzyme M reductase operon protein D [Methanobacterium sp. BAmetb5]|uniref:methyl-coenzyme M reductase operon protein D n=1 Tax=Methanobacterium sp. BAmetb5 TaxID=2025351 RepID=UPI000E94C8DC|nr:methyl-coenzyme M reductase operon protein D [Methanobacterium sp. BAmetb5]AXV40349.1 MAG: methyl-coenzyme M reductase operon protein D [Methanobacterium sp. BAmetb5]
MEPIKATDVRIFPHRRLKPETTEKILNELLDLEGVLRFLVNGESLPKIVGYGPARGTSVNHPDRKIITVKGKEVELLVSVGDIIVTIRHENLEEFVEKTKSILEETLNFGFDVRVGIFTRTQTTISDNLKVAYGIEEDFDPSLIGLVDPKTNSKETVKLIGD